MRSKGSFQQPERIRVRFRVRPVSGAKNSSAIRLTRQRWNDPMQQLTSEGRRIVDDLAGRYGFSTEAVTPMLIAVLNGNGSMARFNHPEFTGSGQWMQGGMTMLSDRFNHGLKGQMGALCNEISSLLSSQPGLLRSDSFQSQSQSGSRQPAQTSGGHMGQISLFVPDPRANWWPAELGSPGSSNSQNNVRCTLFSGKLRLAVETGGDVWVYDTLDHQTREFTAKKSELLARLQIMTGPRSAGWEVRRPGVEFSVI